MAASSLGAITVTARIADYLLIWVDQYEEIARHGTEHLRDAPKRKEPRQAPRSAEAQGWPWTGGRYGSPTRNIGQLGMFAVVVRPLALMRVVALDSTGLRVLPGAYCKP